VFLKGNFQLVSLISDLPENMKTQKLQQQNL
jgi:hypothetical protein